MIELQRHIEVLLLTNECVIVPDFGGFMTHKIAARYDEADQLFLPPMCALGFNPQLRINDSVLAQSYVEAYDISYPEALRRIDQEVTELKAELSEEGSYQMDNLGRLSVNQEGNYEFTPCEAGILSPRLYGLDAFSFKRLGDHREIVEIAPSNAVVVPITPQEETDTATMESAEPEVEEAATPARTVRMTWIRNAVAVAAAIVVFFLLATPISNIQWEYPKMSHWQQQLLYKLMPQDTNVVPATPVVEKKAPVVKKIAAVQKAPVVETVQESAVEHTTPTAAPTITYCLVLASQVRMANAEIFVKQLQEEGYQDARILVRNNVIRVVCGQFDSESEAYRQLRQVTYKEKYADAWVYKVKPEV
jgi:hypothetical protein